MAFWLEWSKISEKSWNGVKLVKRVGRIYVGVDVVNFFDF